MSKFILSAFADEIDDDLDVQMDVLDKYRIKFIEMRGVNGKNLVEYNLDEVRQIKNQLFRRGFRLSSIGSPIGKINILDDFDPHFKLFKHTLDIARIMETNYIRMFSFFIPKGENPAKYRDEVIARWRSFVCAAEDTGITLLHENEKDIYGDTPERCLDLVETMNSPNLKMVFDPANFVQCDVESYPKAYLILKKHIVYMHIKDALYSDHSVKPVGWGDGNAGYILSDLYKSGFEGFLSLEPHLGDLSGLDDLVRELDFTGINSWGQKRFAVVQHALSKMLANIEGKEQ